MLGNVIHSLVCSYTPQVPKLSHVLAKKYACTGERTVRICFAEAHLHHLRVWEVDSNMARTHCIPSPDSAAVVSWCWALKIDLQSFDACRHQLQRVAKTC